jgi:hypothetical protein
VAVAVATAPGCSGPPLPEPARGPHVGADPIAVPYPPPPARTDVIGPAPPEARDPVWVDGQWIWRGRKWVWTAGQWWERPPDQVWAAPAVIRVQGGQLVWFEGRWRPAGEAPPQIALSAVAPPFAVRGGSEPPPPPPPPPPSASAPVRAGDLPSNREPGEMPR